MIGCDVPRAADQIGIHCAKNRAGPEPVSAAAGTAKCARRGAVLAARGGCGIGITRLIMKMRQDEFRAAMAPVLADLERDHPSLLRVEELPDHPDLHAYLWDSTGAGTGVYLSDANEGAELVADAADQVQGAAFEALWREGESTSWPSCPRHPDTHSLAPGAEAGEAVWRCQVNAETEGIIGFLNRA